MNRFARPMAEFRGHFSGELESWKGSGRAKTNENVEILTWYSKIKNELNKVIAPPRICEDLWFQTLKLEDLRLARPGRI